MKTPCTTLQLELATKLGVDVAKASAAVAAALIREAVAVAIGEPAAASPSSERQRAFAEALGINVHEKSRVVASVMIDEALFQRNSEVLAKLKLRPGDKVLKRHRVEVSGEVHEYTTEAIVSSVQPSLRVFFKGGNGRGAWPSELELPKAGVENAA